MYVDVIWLLIGLFSLLSNSIVACIILFCRKLRNRNNAILCSMLISSCGISILYVLPGRAFQRLRIISIFFCSTLPSVAYATITCYGLHLCGSCLDKVISIVSPYRHQRYFTTRNTGIAIMCFWIIPYFLLAIPFFTYLPYSSQRCIYTNYTELDFHRDRIFQTVFFTFMIFVPIGGTLTLYIMAFVKLNTSNSQASHGSYMRRNWKIARQMICMLGLFSICWLPLFFTFIIVAYRLTQFTRLLFEIFSYTAFSYHVFNPIFIAYFHVGIYHQTKRLCRRIQRKRTFSIYPQNNYQFENNKLQLQGATPPQQSIQNSFPTREENTNQSGKSQ